MPLVYKDEGSAAGFGDLLRSWYIYLSLDGICSEQVLNMRLLLAGGGMISLSVDFYDEMVKRYVSRSGVPFLVVEFVSRQCHVLTVYLGSFADTSALPGIDWLQK